MPVQTEVKAPGIGYEGQLATLGEGTIFARKNGTGTTIPFGRAVCDDEATPGGIRLPSGPTDKIRGILLAEPATEIGPDGTWACRDGQIANLLTHGAGVFLIPEQDMVRADDVYVRAVVDGGDATKTPGRIRKDAGGSDGVKDKFTLTLGGDLADPDNVIGVTVEGVALTQGTTGSGHADDVLEALAAQIRAKAKVGSAVVTKVTGAGTNDRVLTVEADQAGVGRLTLATATATGTTPPTFTLARTATGTESTQKALLVPGLRLVDDALAGTLANVFVSIG